MLGSLRREERIGLAVAGGLHAALVLAFLLQPKTREDIAPAQRMTVNLASEVGLEAAAPQPVAESRAAMAPVLSEEIAPAAVPLPQPRLDRPVAPPDAMTADPRPRRRLERTAAAPPKPAAKKGGAQREFEQAFAGAGDSATTTETRVPANRIGDAEKASLLQAIVREVKPHWQPPSGPEVDRITTFLRFRLNPDGSLAARPTVVRQTGVNDTNRAQAGRHQELAIRAVQLAAPFDLPEKLYNAWQVVGPLGFNLELAQ
jgi:hypothetical protein